MIPYLISNHYIVRPLYLSSSCGISHNISWSKNIGYSQSWSLNKIYNYNDQQLIEMARWAIYILTL